MCPQANGTYFKIMKYLLTTTIAAVPLATTSLADPIHDFPRMVTLLMYK